jgi:hypothetical protein
MSDIDRSPGHDVAGYEAKRHSSKELLPLSHAFPIPNAAGRRFQTTVDDHQDTPSHQRCSRLGLVLRIADIREVLAGIQLCIPETLNGTMAPGVHTGARVVKP